MFNVQLLILNRRVAKNLIFGFEKKEWIIYNYNDIFPQRILFARQPLPKEWMHSNHP
jgi:hypothetical protein